VTPPASRVSVVLCTYDGAAYVGRMIESLGAQTLTPDEIIVSDDGSNDETFEIVSAGLRAYPGRVIAQRNQANLGVRQNFEQAMRLAQGEFVLLCDQDDVWHANKVERMLAEAELNPDTLLLHSDARIVDESDVFAGHTLLGDLRLSFLEQAHLDRDDLLSVLLRRNVVTGAATAVRRELLDYALPIPEGFWHDEWLALIAAAVGRVVCVRETLMDYRIHANNQLGLRGVAASTRLRAMTSRRGEYHATRQRKLELLLERLRMLGRRVPADRLRLVEACSSHWRIRAGLPSRRIARLALTLREAKDGGYRRFSSGWRSVLRDLVEPLG